jgi:hypothetical protein
MHVEDCSSRVLAETFNVLLGQFRSTATLVFGPHDFTWVICDAIKVTGSARLFSHFDRKYQGLSLDETEPRWLGRGNMNRKVV